MAPASPGPSAAVGASSVSWRSVIGRSLLVLGCSPRRLRGYVRSAIEDSLYSLCALSVVCGRPRGQRRTSISGLVHSGCALHTTAARRGRAALLALIREIASRWSAERVSLIAAGVAFYCLLALLP